MSITGTPAPKTGRIPSTGRISDDGSRWMGVGRSANAESRAAGVEATRAALHRDDCALLVVFAGIDHDARALLDGVHEVAPDVPVIGCSTHGEIGPGGPLDGSVVVTALGGSGISVATAAVENASGRQREAGAEVARCVADVADRPHRVLVLLTDGFLREQRACSAGSTACSGPGSPVQGAAADGWRMSVVPVAR